MEKSKGFKLSEEEVMNLFEKVIKDIQGISTKNKSNGFYISKNKVGIVRYFLSERIKMIKEKSIKLHPFWWGWTGLLGGIVLVICLNNLAFYRLIMKLPKLWVLISFLIIFVLLIKIVIKNLIERRYKNGRQ